MFLVDGIGITKWGMMGIEVEFTTNTHIVRLETNITKGCSRFMVSLVLNL